VQDQQQKLELCLEALGERAERIAALEADAAEMRAVFRGALEDAVGQLAEARAAAAAEAAAAAQPQQAEASAAASTGS
jgi:F0F1-type ATP synthase membrane subunit b/b'